MSFYTHLVRPFLFTLDPEWAHQTLLHTLHRLNISQNHWLKLGVRRLFTYNHLALHQQIWGYHFPNPLGLAAGFDKDGLGLNWWADLGFGFAELGTVTPCAQAGQPRPRLFRLPADQALINRMGFNNQGVSHLKAQLAQGWSRQKPAIPIGINLGKGKDTPLELAWQDYRYGFQQLQRWGDYFVVNVSSPNTPGLRDLQTRSLLAPILETLQQENRQKKPLLLKISPDLSEETVLELLELVRTYHLAGVIATNTTTARPALKSRHRHESGGLSGCPLAHRSTQLIQFIYQHTQGQLPIIGVGGIFSAADAWEKITAGACLLQIYTGWVYQGPGVVRQILEGLVAKLMQHNLAFLSQAVGLQHRTQAFSHQVGQME
ncbi:MAG: quinone-dependent dihydroorotate dehydrogenase [Gloeomargarita sp. SKYBB_i_bin120]|nr:quinone-dependent dihydroorotate dehydrogenase [Gloeomargarita sp. SKYG98]MCS7291360.1 quinone-dependent dihydroorotate dehydrogenase [Gloeomargarita sp. SKYB120]MDW8176919.1 quinone-dependent dihydroorotate dehydrogenase [Gloeomargarita sp. SKYBB_i_bin120]